MAKGIQKKRAVVSYANMSPEVAAAFKEKYPKGYADYMGNIVKVDKPDGTFFYAVSVDLPDAIYLVKVAVTIDDYEDVEKSLFGGGNDDEGSDSDSFPEEGTSNLPDDDEDND